MVQGRSTKFISMIKWIRTSRLAIENSLSQGSGAYHAVVLLDDGLELVEPDPQVVRVEVPTGVPRS